MQFRVAERDLFCACVSLQNRSTHPPLANVTLLSHRKPFEWLKNASITCATAFAACLAFFVSLNFHLFWSFEYGVLLFSARSLLALVRRAHSTNCFFMLLPKCTCAHRCYDHIFVFRSFFPLPLKLNYVNWSRTCPSNVCGLIHCTIPISPCVCVASAVCCAMVEASV